MCNGRFPIGRMQFAGVFHHILWPLVFTMLAMLNRSQLPELHKVGSRFRKMYSELYEDVSTALIHHGVHREYFTDLLGPVNQLNCLRLEAKHQPFKKYHGQLYWPLAPQTLAERHNIRTAHEMHLRKKAMEPGNDDVTSKYDATVQLSQHVPIDSPFHAEICTRSEYEVSASEYSPMFIGEAMVMCCVCSGPHCTLLQQDTGGRVLLREWIGYCRW